MSSDQGPRQSFRLIEAELQQVESANLFKSLANRISRKQCLVAPNTSYSTGIAVASECVRRRTLPSLADIKEKSAIFKTRHGEYLLDARQDVALLSSESSASSGPMVRSPVILSIRPSSSKFRKLTAARIVAICSAGSRSALLRLFQAQRFGKLHHSLSFHLHSLKST
jgi:hypothetical protein